MSACSGAAEAQHPPHGCGVGSGCFPGLLVVCLIMAALAAVEVSWRLWRDPCRAPEGDLLASMLGEAEAIFAAIAEYETDNAVPVASLQDLVPAYLPEIPIPGWGEEPWLYLGAREDDGVVAEIRALCGEGSGLRYSECFFFVTLHADGTLSQRRRCW